jgi:two-component system sensor histidine kinase KdpD
VTCLVGEQHRPGPLGQLFGGVDGDDEQGPIVLQALRIRQGFACGRRESVSAARGAIGARYDGRMDIVTGSTLADLFALQAGVGLALFAVVIGVIVRALWRARRRVEGTRLHTRVLADPGLLERALANVIVNALNHSPDGRRVRVVAGRAGDAVDVRVVDRGLGVPAGERDRVFLPFQRLGDVGGSEGVGLGLAVAKGFVEAIGGDVEIEDTPGGGLTIVFRLRAAP